MNKTVYLLIVTCLSFSAAAIANEQNHQTKKVLIGSPIRQKPLILKEFLQSLDELDKKDLMVSYYFIDDNLQEEPSRILSEFSQNHQGLTYIMKTSSKNDGYQANETTHYWGDDVIWKIAAFKDTILEYARHNDFDYVFLIDSDIVLYPQTLAKLIEDQKDIVSEIFWTSWTPGTMKLPQVWLYDMYTQYQIAPKETISNDEGLKRFYDFINMLRQPGIFEVGGLGACTLISKNAIQAGVNFKKIKNITFWGEDRHFCIRASALGFSLFVDTHYPAYHIYRETDLPGVATFKENCKKGLYQM